MYSECNTYYYLNKARESSFSTETLVTDIIISSSTFVHPMQKKFHCFLFKRNSLILMSGARLQIAVEMQKETASLLLFVGYKRDTRG